jgi:ribonuclease HI
MPWKKMRLRSDDVFVHVNDAGEPVTEGGRVEIRYRPDAMRAYHASLRNLAPSTDPTIYPESHCTSLDGVTVQPGLGIATPIAAAAASAAKANSTGVETSGKPATPNARSSAAKSVAVQHAGHASDPSVVVAYADGACSGNPGPCGLGLVLLDGSQRTERSEYLGTGTNNIAELTAIRRALEAVAPDRRMTIHTDSQYSIGVLSKGWKPKANQTLIAEIKSLLAHRPRVSLHYVPGHAGVPLNERADALARDAVRTMNTVETVHGSASGRATQIAPSTDLETSSPTDSPTRRTAKKKPDLDPETPPSASATKPRRTSRGSRSAKPSSPPTRTGR